MQLIINEFSCGNVYKYFFDAEKKVCFVNNESKNIDVETTMQKLLNVLCGAETKMENNSIIDGNTFEIQIIKGESMRNYHFKNSFPKGFFEFTKILGGLK